MQSLSRTSTLRTRPLAIPHHPYDGVVFEFRVFGFVAVPWMWDGSFAV